MVHGGRYAGRPEILGFCRTMSAPDDGVLYQVRVFYIELRDGQEGGGTTQELVSMLITPVSLTDADGGCIDTQDSIRVLNVFELDELHYCALLPTPPPPIEGEEPRLTEVGAHDENGSATIPTDPLNYPPPHGHVPAVAPKRKKYAPRLRRCTYGTDQDHVLTGSRYELINTNSMLGPAVVEPASMTAYERQFGAALFQPSVERGTTPNFDAIGTQWRAAALALLANPTLPATETLRNTSALGLRKLFKEIDERSRLRRTELSIPQVAEMGLASLRRDLASPGNTEFDVNEVQEVEHPAPLAVNEGGRKRMYEESLHDALPPRVPDRSAEYLANIDDTPRRRLTRCCGQPCQGHPKTHCPYGHDASNDASNAPRDRKRARKG